MKPVIARYNEETGTFLRSFNVRYEYEGLTYETTLYASCFDNAENILEAIKRNGIIHSELIETEE